MDLIHNKLKRIPGLLESHSDNLQQTSWEEIYSSSTTDRRKNLIGLHMNLSKHQKYTLIDVANNEDRKSFRQRDFFSGDENVCKIFIVTDQDNQLPHTEYNVYLIYGFIRAMGQLNEPLALSKAHPYFGPCHSSIKNFLDSDSAKDVNQRMNSKINALILVRKDHSLRLSDLVPDTTMFMNRNKKSLQDSTTLIDKDYLEGLSSNRDNVPLLRKDVNCGIILTSDSLILIEIMLPLEKNGEILNLGKLESIRIMNFIKINRITVHERDCANMKCSSSYSNSGNGSNTVSSSSGLGSTEDINSDVFSLDLENSDNFSSFSKGSSSIDIQSEIYLEFERRSIPISWDNNNQPSEIYQLTFPTEETCNKWRDLIRKQKAKLTDEIAKKVVTILIFQNGFKVNTFHLDLRPDQTARDIKLALLDRMNPSEITHDNYNLWIKLIYDDGKELYRILDTCETPLVSHNDSNYELFLTNDPTNPFDEKKRRKSRKFFGHTHTKTPSESSLILCPMRIFGQRPMNIWTTDNIPNGLIAVFYILSKYGPEELHIFRKSSTKQNYQSLMKVIDEETETWNEEDFKPVNCACVLKKYFERIPDGIFDGYKFDQVSSKDSSNELKCLLMKMNKVDKQIMAFLLYTIRKISDNSHINQMNTYNLAVVWTPNLANVTVKDLPQTIKFVNDLFSIGLDFVEYEYIERIESYFDKIKVCMPKEREKKPEMPRDEETVDPPVFRRKKKPDSEVNETKLKRNSTIVPEQVKSPVKRESFLKNNQRVQMNKTKMLSDLETNSSIKRGSSLTSTKSNESNTLRNQDSLSDQSSSVENLDEDEDDDDGI